MSWPQRKDVGPLGARRRTIRKPVAAIEVPRWVPAKLHLEYMRRAERDGEEVAASWARLAKKALVR